MSRLDEKARDYASRICQHDIDSIRYMQCDTFAIARADFKAGALCLLEEAREWSSKENLLLDVLERFCEGKASFVADAMRRQGLDPDKAEKNDIEINSKKRFEEDLE